MAADQAAMPCQLHTQTLVGVPEPLSCTSVVQLSGVSGNQLAHWKHRLRWPERRRSSRPIWGGRREGGRGPGRGVACGVVGRNARALGLQQREKRLEGHVEKLDARQRSCLAASPTPLANLKPLALLTWRKRGAVLESKVICWLAATR